MKEKKTINPTRVVDGIKHELAMWLVVEQRPDGILVTLRLCQDQDHIGGELVAAGLCTQAEVDSGEAHKKLNPTFHLLWTPSKFMVKEKA
jgi:hypothetical protein